MSRVEIKAAKHEKEESRPTYLSEKTYVSVGAIAIIGVVIFFGADLRNNNEVTKDSITKLNSKIDAQVSLLRAEKESLQKRVFNRFAEMRLDNDRKFSEVNKELAFLRERLINSMNEIKRTVYKIEGKLEVSLPGPKKKDK